MLELIYTTKFAKDVRLVKKRGLDITKLKIILGLLSHQEDLPKRCRPHTLSGQWNHCWECHIEPDWLLIYRFEGKAIHLIRTGTHSDLF